MARILILSPHFPCPLQSGGHVRLYNVIRHLSRHGHQVSLLSFFSKAQEPYLKHVGDMCYRVETVSGRSESSLAGRIRGQINVLGLKRFAMKMGQTIRGVPYHYCRFAHPGMTTLLRRMVREDDYQFIQAEYSNLLPYLLDPVVRERGVRPVVVELDVNFVAARRTSRYVYGVRKPFYMLESRRMVSYERALLPKMFRVVTMSEQDAVAVRQISPEAVTLVVPNGVDVEYYHFTPRREHAQGLLFVGGSGHFPNRDAMRFFNDEILPRIHAECPQMTLTVIGHFQAKPGEYASAIRFQGFVEDIRPSMAEHSVFVVPLRIGSGTRLKILEAFAAGIPVVSTRVGAEGIDVHDGKNILIADSAEQFAKAILHLHRRPEAASEIARDARATVEARYRWEHVLAPLERLYSTGVSGRG